MTQPSRTGKAPVLRIVPVPLGCAIGCVTAAGGLCRCSCGGANHGVAKWDWPGLFCEGCGTAFGAADPWVNGCYVQSGTSEKYLSRTGTGFAPASWCGPCYSKSHRVAKAEMDSFRRDMGYPVYA